MAETHAVEAFLKTFVLQTIALHTDKGDERGLLIRTLTHPPGKPEQAEPGPPMVVGEDNFLEILEAAKQFVAEQRALQEPKGKAH